MKIELLHIPDCPSVAPLVRRLAVVLTGRADVQVDRTVVSDDSQAAATGMTGSPTLLIDGVDPFGGPHLSPGTSCRLYRDADGSLSGVPPLNQLQAVLTPTETGHDQPA